MAPELKGSKQVMGYSPDFRSICKEEELADIVMAIATVYLRGSADPCKSVETPEYSILTRDQT